MIFTSKLAVILNAASAVLVSAIPLNLPQARDRTSELSCTKTDTKGVPFVSQTQGDGVNTGLTCTYVELIHLFPSYRRDSQFIGSLPTTLDVPTAYIFFTSFSKK